jgi:hypothetical protein
MTWFMVLFLLLAAHAAFDYALQGDTVAVNKNPNANTPLQKHVPWYYWLGSHAFQHGGAVALITGSAWLGLAETVAHFAIDYGKCLNKYTIHGDQLLHLVCKLTWLIIWVFIS